MTPLKNISIRRKLIMIQLATAFLAIFTCCAFFLYNDIKGFKTNEIRNKHSIAEVVGINLISPLLFNDPDAAGKILANLKSNPDIQAVSVFDKKGNKLVSYLKPGESSLSLEAGTKPGARQSSVLEKKFVINYPLVEGKERVGTLVIRGELLEMNSIINRYVRGTLLILLFGIIVSVAISILLQRSISSPIINLAATAKLIADKGDYSIRAVKLGNDEIGDFTESFNQMVMRIQKQNETLSEFSTRLENQNKALHNIVSERIKEGSDKLGPAIRAILQTAADTMKTERVSVWLYNEERTALECIDLYELSKKNHTQGAILYAKDYPHYFEAMQSSRMINADDAKHDPRTSEYSEKYLIPLGISSMLDAPIRQAGRSVGIVCFEHVGPMRSWALDEQLFAGAIADSISILMESAERNSAEKALREKEEQLSTIYDAVGDSIFSVSVEKDGRFRFTSVNKALEITSGFSHDQIVGKYIDELIPQPALGRVLEQNRIAIQEKKLVRFEEVLSLPAGELMGEITLAPICDEAGNCTLLIGSIHDITERKRIEQKIRKLNEELEERVKERTASLEKARQSLEESESKYRKMVEEVGDIVYSTDAAGYFTYVNPIAKKVTGYVESELIGKQFVELIDPAWKAKVAAFYREQRNNKIPETVFTFPIITKSGEKKWVEQIVTQNRKGDEVIGHHAIVRDITKNKQAEEEIQQKAAELLKLNTELKDSESQIQALFNSAPDAVIVINHESTILKWNRKAEMLFGWEGTEVIGKPLYNYIIPERYRQRHKEGMQRYLQTGVGPVLDRDVELQAVTKKGIEFDVQLSISPVNVEKEKLFIGFIRDITVRKRAEQVLKEYEFFFNNSHDLVCISNMNGYLELVNPNFEKVLGYTKKELLEVPYYNFIHPDDLKRTLEEVDKLKAGVETVNFVNRYRKKDGSYVWFDWNSTPDVSKGKLYSAARDITEKKKAEEELMEKASLLQATFDSSVGGILVVNKNGKIVVLNKRFQVLWNIPEEIVSTGDDKKALDFVLDQLKDPAQFLDKVKELYNQPEKESFDILEFKDGRIFERYSMPQRMGGEVVGRVWNFIDVTEKKRAEEELVRSEHFLDSVVENIPNMIFVKDAKDLKFVRFNKAGEELLGYKKSELVGKNDYDLFPKNEADFFATKDKKALNSGKSVEIEEESVHTKYKGERILETKKIPILDEKGKPLYLLGISNDITDLKKLLADLEKKSKELQRSNTELEQFAYVASHDLQEPLRTISNYVELLEEAYTEGKFEDVKEYFVFITTASTRMQTLIKDLLEFSRVGRNPVFVPVDCNKIMEDLMSEMSVAIKESNATINYSKLPVVRGIEVELKRLFQNLISNSIKFRKKDVAPKIDITATEKGDEYLFTIKDNGIGMEEKFMPKLFTIFQRLPNATSYPGTGIGLATAKKIVSLHNGKIWLESKLNEGSTFYFTIHK